MSKAAAGFRGVATGWTGVDVSTPLLPEVVPETDANLVSFYGEREAVMSDSVSFVTVVDL